MITEQDVRDAIGKAVDGFDLSALSAGDDFFDAGLDSLDHATVLLGIQEDCGLTIPDEAVDQCRSINGILEYAKSNS
jgi:acyl carrier protein